MSDRRPQGDGPPVLAAFEGHSPGWPGRAPSHPLKRTLWRVRNWLRLGSADACLQSGAPTRGHNAPEPDESDAAAPELDPLRGVRIVALEGAGPPQPGFIRRDLLTEERFADIAEIGRIIGITDPLRAVGITAPSESGEPPALSWVEQAPEATGARSRMRSRPLGLVTAAERRVELDAVRGSYRDVLAALVMLPPGADKAQRKLERTARRLERLLALADEGRRSPTAVTDPTELADDEAEPRERER